MTPRVVVVGASLSGVRTVQSLRRHGFSDDVVLVGAEPDADSGIACDRPPLSKGFLADPTATAPPLASREALADLDVRLVTGRATDLDLAGKRVLLHGGEPLEFGSLVIATGSSPRTVPGLQVRPGVHVLRSAADGSAIRRACVSGARVVVVGGGFIGSEVAWTAVQLGCDVTVVEPLPTLMARGLGPELGDNFTRRHVASGVAVRTGVGVAAIEGEDSVTAVRLTDGARIPADVVVLGLGTTPVTGWLDGAGLALADGVLCDSHLAARGVDGVFAVGDVARWHHPRYGEDVRIEHWTNAVETANVVAANLAGQPVVHDSVPYVWSDQLGSRLQIFGRVPPQSAIHVVQGNPNDSFVALAGSGDSLHGVIGFGMKRQLLPYHRLLLDGATLADALRAG